MGKTEGREEEYISESGRTSCIGTLTHSERKLKTTNEKKKSSRRSEFTDSKSFDDFDH